MALYVARKSIYGEQRWLLSEFQRANDTYRHHGQAYLYAGRIGRLQLCYYGATTIGHEMTHGFDSEGANFNEEGILEDWWTAADKTVFEQKQNMLISVFNNIKVLGDKYVDGKQTVGENMADLGGVGDNLSSVCREENKRGVQG